MTKQAIIYTRFSPRPNAEECTSCEKQEERCRAYCNRKGHEVEAVFRDRNKTGGILNRPGLLAAIACLTSSKVLVVDSSDRLARDMLVNLTIRQQVTDAGATIEYANGSPTEDTPEGTLLTNILAAFAAYERDRIRLRTKQGLDRKRKNGEKLGGKIPIGWMEDPEDPRKLVVCVRERGAIIEACLRNAHTGQTSEEIAKGLTFKFGFCRDKHWSPRTVRMLLRKHAYWADPIDGDCSLEPTHP